MMPAWQCCWAYIKSSVFIKLISASWAWTVAVSGFYRPPLNCVVVWHCCSSCCSWLQVWGGEILVLAPARSCYVYVRAAGSKSRLGWNWLALATVGACGASLVSVAAIYSCRRNLYGRATSDRWAAALQEACLPPTKQQTPQSRPPGESGNTSPLRRPQVSPLTVRSELPFGWNKRHMLYMKSKLFVA